MSAGGTTPAQRATTPTPGSTEPWPVRGYLGWIRDLATRPSAPDVRWPDISIDDDLIRDYDRAGAFIVTLYGDVVAPRGGEIWMEVSQVPVVESGA